MTAQPVQALHVQALEKSFKELHVLRGAASSPYSAPTAQARPRL
ncbi:MAG: hypothetical protein WC005_10525 [Candidatus Nanopelagicales bacterium]